MLTGLTRAASAAGAVDDERADVRVAEQATDIEALVSGTDVAAE